MSEIAVIEQTTALAVLTDEKKYSELYRKVRDEVSGHVADLTTVTGRAAIASLAYKVTRTKTAIDEAGKLLNSEARKKIDAVDASRRKIRVELEALADEVRKPLTEWEDVEKARKEKAEEALSAIADCANFPGGSAEIQGFIERLTAMEIDPDVFQEGTHEAVLLKSSSLGALQTRLKDALKSEADAAELVRLRAEQIEREAREHAAAVAKADADKVAEMHKWQAEEAKRIEDEQRVREERAAQTAREEATRKAQAEHAEQLARIEAENQRLAKAEADRVAAAKKVADDEAARQKDRAHRGKIMGEAKAAMMELGVTEDVAKKIVLAIVASEIPHVTLRF